MESFGTAESIVWCVINRAIDSKQNALFSRVMLARRLPSGIGALSKGYLSQIENPTNKIE